MAGWYDGMQVKILKRVSARFFHVHHNLNLACTNTAFWNRTVYRLFTLLSCSTRHWNVFIYKCLLKVIQKHAILWKQMLLWHFIHNLQKCVRCCPNRIVFKCLQCHKWHTECRVFSIKCLCSCYVYWQCSIKLGITLIKWTECCNLRIWMSCKQQIC